MKSDVFVGVMKNHPEPTKALFNEFMGLLLISILDGCDIYCTMFLCQDETQPF